MSMMDDFKNDLNNLKDEANAEKNKFEKEAYDLKDRESVSAEDKAKAKLGKAEASAKEAWDRIKSKF